MKAGSVSHRAINFPPYSLDLDAGFLRAGDRAITLRPKTWAVLCYLAERPGVLVTKEELLDAVWGGIAVTEATLTKSIGEIREALRDEVRHPRYVETVHRRGFRFVSVMEETRPDHASRDPAPAPEPPASLIGREGELGRLHALLAASSSGNRQIGFVTGEGGIGKTTLVEAFLASLGAADVSIATGQCVRRHSGEEPLMPVLEAVGRLARGRHASRVVQLLRERAPAWLIQLPWLVESGSLRELRAGVSGTTPERMLRVFAELVEELTADMTLVLVLEDLHWADASTVDLLAVLAERREPARLLVLGSYRPAEAIAHAGPFDAMRRGLDLKRRSVEISLSLLPPSGVEHLLAARFGGVATPSPLARLLHAHTDGNPLFLVTAVDYLVAQGWLERTEDGVALRAELDVLERHIPGSLQELVEVQALGLDQFEVTVLEAASVAGLEFGAQAVAAALDVPAEQVEDACERLVRSHRFLRASDTEAWPDGAVAARYAFAHALYQRAFYYRISVSRRRRLHQNIGERLEAGFGSRAADIAAELAAHFERGHEPARAITWLASAAAAADRRFAPREAAGYLRRALRLIEREPEGPERWQRELGVTTALGAAVIATSGFAAEEAWTSLTRAHELVAKVGTSVDAFRIVYGLSNASSAAADTTHTPRLAAEIATVAEQVGTEEARLVAAMLPANVAMWQGRYGDAAALADVAAADPARFGEFVPGVNPAVWCKGFDGWRLWLLGEPDAARAAATAVVASARLLPDPVDLTIALFFAAQVHTWCGDLGTANAFLRESRALADEHGFHLWAAALRNVAGTLRLVGGDAAAAVLDFEHALTELRGLGIRVYIPAVLVGIAEASVRLQQIPIGLAAVDEGLELARTTLSQWQAPELWRVRGELLAASGASSDEVESCFGHALELAGAQGARAFELRAATALARWLAGRRRDEEGRALLAPRYAMFVQGLDTADLRAARALLTA